MLVVGVSDFPPIEMHDGWGSLSSAVSTKSREGWASPGVSPVCPPVFCPPVLPGFNNRKNPYLFRDTMLKLIHSENLEYKELTKAA
jgi:hypothetical protein